MVSYAALLSSGGAFAQAISKISIGFFFQGRPPRGGFGLISPRLGHDEGSHEYA
ncbi:hypothetical protein [Corynebacterium rouxii]|uniref:Uncharacterized protein n=1 Tax=Corynebacterium rouxii TaxID=2719119 RepID=A0ABU3PNR2_9CORY|nr:hypothetical protein [Corynebacterium rouxii]MDT9409227.1 hypothetical protein [Corynebacterium rouxii]MDT9411460.1 hypothetical protein [Corynebacterium rouxii]